MVADEPAGPAETNRVSTRPTRSETVRSETEVARLERVLLGLFGAAFLVAGLRRRSLGGLGLAAVGGWLSFRAVAGSGGGEAEEPTVSRSVTVGKSTGELSALLRDPTNLDRVVGPFVRVSSADEEHYRWRVSGPYDRGPTWETRLVTAPDERLRWEPVDDAAPFDAWTVELRPAPGDRGTEVTLRVDFDPPGGRFGRGVVRRLDAAPEALVGTALDRLKSLAETGEIPTLERNPSARGRGDVA